MSCADNSFLGGMKMRMMIIFDTVLGLAVLTGLELTCWQCWVRKHVPPYLAKRENFN